GKKTGTTDGQPPRGTWQGWAQISLKDRRRGKFFILPVFTCIDLYLPILAGTGAGGLNKAPAGLGKRAEREAFGQGGEWMDSDSESCPPRFPVRPNIHAAIMAHPGTGIKPTVVF